MRARRWERPAARQRGQERDTSSQTRKGSHSQVGAVGGGVGQVLYVHPRPQQILNHVLKVRRAPAAGSGGRRQAAAVERRPWIGHRRRRRSGKHLAWLARPAPQPWRLPRPRLHSAAQHGAARRGRSQQEGVLDAPHERLALRQQALAQPGRQHGASRRRRRRRRRVAGPRHAARQLGREVAPAVGGRLPGCGTWGRAQGAGPSWQSCFWRTTCTLAHHLHTGALLAHWRATCSTVWPGSGAVPAALPHAPAGLAPAAAAPGTLAPGCQAASYGEGQAGKQGGCSRRRAGRGRHVSTCRAGQARAGASRPRCWPPCAAHATRPRPAAQAHVLSANGASTGCSVELFR